MREYVQVDVNLLDSVGLFRLASFVGGEGNALLALVRLWAWAIRQECEDGSLAWVDDAQIERACGVGAETLVLCGFLKGPQGAREIAGWRERYQTMEIKRASRRERQRRWREAHKGVAEEQKRRVADASRRRLHDAPRNAPVDAPDLDVDKDKNILIPSVPETPSVSATAEGYPTFDCDGKPKTWTPSKALIDTWTALYPKLDLLAEVRKAQAWVSADPARKKTAKGMPRFLVNWFNRATDRPVRTDLPVRGSVRPSGLGPDGLEIRMEQPPLDPEVAAQAKLNEANRYRANAAKARAQGLTEVAQRMEEQASRFEDEARNLAKRKVV